jgi:hypothetical protein
MVSKAMPAGLVRQLSLFTSLPNDNLSIEEAIREKTDQEPVVVSY